MLDKSFIPAKPFPAFKWQWACLTCTEGLNDPVVLLGVLQRMFKLEPSGLRFSSPEFAREMDDLTDDLYAVGHENYRDTEHINTFVFSKNDSPTITLYFQPVIWGYYYSESVNNGIALRRTTSLSFDRHNNQAVRSLKSVGRSSTYYTPDYVLKCSGSDGDTYIIVDAKLSQSCLRPFSAQVRFSKN